MIGPDDAIEHNRTITQQLDWEVELAVVMGQNRAPGAEAKRCDFVFGYSVMIDVSARDNRRAGHGSTRRARTPTRRSAPAS